ncbi:sensor histidine kinase [Propionibacteriaceae bacterium Y1923]
MLQRVRQWLSWDETWQRPRPPIGRGDLLLVMLSFILGWLNIESLLSYAGEPDGVHNPWVRSLVLASACLLLLFRRRYPLVIMVLLSAHFFLTSNYVPEVAYTLVYQLLPFLGVYSGVAWSRDRKAAVLTAVGLTLGLTVWLAWLFVVGRVLDTYAEFYTEANGLFSQNVGVIIAMTLSNFIYLVAAVLMGQVAWRQARDHAEAISQAETIRRQTVEIAEHAVLEERLRLARELHDVVAHHISVMGVQAAAARTVMSRDPELAGTALANVEQSSRDAVTQMRGLLGTLRSPRDQRTQTSPSRDPEPTLAEVPALVEANRTPGFSVHYDLVETDGVDVEQVSLPVALTIYRTIQESLANVRRHSTARSARVVVRLGAEVAEVEVTDDGSPRPNTSGSGFGQTGIRERVGSLGGEVELGPRPGGGYRVRARLPRRADSIQADPVDVAGLAG